MVLPDWKIKRYIQEGKIKVEPFEEKNVGPASLDVRLGFRFRIFRAEFLDVLDVKKYRDDLVFTQEMEDRTIYAHRYSDVIEVKSPDVPIIIHPNEFVLASIYEYVELPDNIAAQLNGRSSIARLGLLVHTSAGWVDPGYKGHLTLEIFNANRVPVKLYPLMRVAQLTFFEMEKAEIPYDKRKGSKYVGEEGATESKISEDFRE